MNHTLHTRRAFVAAATACAAWLASPVHAQSAPRVAVTDLGYTQRVAEYFEAATASSRGSLNANANSVTASSSASLTYVAGTHSYLEHRELRAFTNDIRGALLKGTALRLVQGKGFDAGEPQPSKAEQALQQVQTGKVAKPVRLPDVNDIIARIRKGEFAGPTTSSSASSPASSSATSSRRCRAPAAPRTSTALTCSRTSRSSTPAPSRSRPRSRPRVQAATPSCCPAAATSCRPTAPR